MRMPALVVSVFVIFLLLHRSAEALGSYRGEAGIIVGLLVVAACVVARALLARERLAAAVRSVGIGLPEARSIYAAGAVSIALMLTIPAFLFVTASSPVLYPGWALLLPGLFAQGGVAEETLFRGYLFGTLRRRHPFWRAAMLSAGPFVAAHLLLFTTMAWPVALASTLLALISSFPLAHLYELGGRTVWAPALVHFVMQGAVKVIEIPDDALAYQMTWLAACTLVPWLAFAFRVTQATSPAAMNAPAPL